MNRTEIEWRYFDLDVQLYGSALQGANYRCSAAAEQHGAD
jgi:hypothetical protein